MGNGTKVAICIATFKRPQFLRDLLISLMSIDTQGFRPHLLVVDNDPSGSASQLVTAMAPSLPMPVSYLIEKHAGIAFARNRLVAEANKIGASFVAFIDDDQLVEPEWLKHLVNSANQSGADAVGGQCLPRFEPGVPQWVQESGLFSEAPRATGSPVRHLATNNVLVRLDEMTKVPGPFETRHEITGGTGTDYLFFDHFSRQGAQSVWCNESIVYERITPSRTTWSWMIRRRYRFGVDMAVRHRQHAPSTAENMRFVALAAIRLVKSGGLLIPATILQGRAGIIRAVGSGANSLGRIVGLLGGTYSEYRRVHGE